MKRTILSSVGGKEIISYLVQLLSGEVEGYLTPIAGPWPTFAILKRKAPSTVDVGGHL